MASKGVMILTIKDETGVANLVLWPDCYAAQRRLVLSASMLACHGQVQRKSEIVHLIADRLEDLSGLLRSVGERNGATSAAGSDLRREAATRHDAGILVPTRDFR